MCELAQSSNSKGIDSAIEKHRLSRHCPDTRDGFIDSSNGAEICNYGKTVMVTKKEQFATAITKPVSDDVYTWNLTIDNMLFDNDGDNLIAITPHVFTKKVCDNFLVIADETDGTVVYWANDNSSIYRFQEETFLGSASDYGTGDKICITLDKIHRTIEFSINGRSKGIENIYVDAGKDYKLVVTLTGMYDQVSLCYDE